MYYWTFRGLSGASVAVRDLQRAVGTLRWYSAVVPIASTYELQRNLVAAQRKAGACSAGQRQYCHLSAAATRELDWWQWLLATNLHHEMLEAPAWYLAKDFSTREETHIYSDAALSVGGGYVIPELSYGQFQWSKEEQALFGTGGGPTDINGMEFVTGLCAIIANREALRDKLVILHCDNTSAVAWINKLRTSQLFGQTWMRLLISVMLSHNILIDCVHIQGVLNIYADALSRYMQHDATDSLIARLPNMPMLSAGSRQTIWSTSTTPRPVGEYLLLLQRLEAQDTRRSFECATSSAGSHPT